MNEQPRSFWSTVGAIVKFLVRLTVVLLFGVGIGAGLYYGVPYVYRNMIQPVQHNSFRLAALEEQANQMQTRYQEDTQLYGSRLTALEARAEQLQADLDALSADNDALQADLQDAQATLEAQDRLIAQLDESLKAQADALQAQAQTLTELSASFQRAQQSAQDTGKVLAGRVGALEAQASAVPAWVDDLAGQLALQQAGQALLKARLLLLEDNPRAAKESLLEAGSFLERASVLLPQQDDLPALRARVEKAPALIDRHSYRTTAELESLWGEVMDIAAQLTPSGPLSAGMTVTSPVTSTAEEPITRTVLLSPLPTPTIPLETP